MPISFFRRQLCVFPCIAILRDHIPAREITAVTDPRTNVEVSGSEYKRHVLITATKAIAPTTARRTPLEPKNILQGLFIRAMFSLPKGSIQTHVANPA